MLTISITPKQKAKTAFRKLYAHLEIITSNASYLADFHVFVCALPIYWHQDRYLDWFIDEDENKNLQKFWGWFLKNIMLYQTKIFINKDMGNSCPKSSDNQGNV